MRNFFYTSLITIMAFSQNISASDQPPAQKISSSGAIFQLNLDYPALGNAYQDPSGLIWGDSGETQDGVRTSKGGAIHCVVKN